MYERARIRNFRGIRDATVTDLGRVNVVVGGSGTGKTSLLEALFVHSGAADPRLLDRTFRPRGVSRDSDSTEIWVRLYEGLFHGGTWAEELVVDAAWKGAPRITRITRDRTGSTQVVGPDGRGESPALVLRTVLDEGDGREQVRRLSLLSGARLATAPAPAPPTHPTLLVSAVGLDGSEQFARAWSEAEGKGDPTTILPALAPFVRGQRVRCRVAVDDGGFPYLAVAVAGRPEAVHPAELGAGFARALAALLVVQANRGGVVLLDEFDNSLHAGLIPDLARALVDAAVAADVQLFVTTHRLEGVDAVLSATVDRPELARVVRARHTPDGGLAFDTWSHAEARGAREREDFDLRMTQ